MADKVRRPAHYTQGGIECIDAIRSALGPEGFRAYCIGNVIKYNWRYRLKNGAEDLRKAQVYLGWAIGSAPVVAQTDMTKPGPPIDPPEGVIPHGVAQAATASARAADPEREDDTGETYRKQRARMIADIAPAIHIACQSGEVVE